jgi:hypothetical protein
MIVGYTFLFLFSFIILSLVRVWGLFVCVELGVAMVEN